MRAVVLDNEAVQALRDERHPKHRLLLAHMAALAGRRNRGRKDEIFVPLAVRVEAGWDRTRPAAATINRLRVVDHVLGAPDANQAAAIVADLHGISVADAHLGVVVQSLPHDDVVVLTSDPGDVARVAGDRTVRIVRV